MLLEKFSPGLDFWGLVTLSLEGQVRKYVLSKAVSTSQFLASLLPCNAFTVTNITLLFQGRE